jgi:hypothetical protein
MRFSQVESLFVVKLIESGYVQFHKSKVSTIGSTPFFSKNSGNSLGLKDFLNSRPAQPSDLAPFFRTEIIRLKWQTTFARGFGHNQRHAQAAFVKELRVLLAE